MSRQKSRHDRLLLGLERERRDGSIESLTAGADEQQSITCPRCGRTSYNPNDIAQGYCGACHAFTSEVR